MTTILETRHSDLLRQRFGVIATRACHTTEDHDETKPRKKADTAYRPLRRDEFGTFFLLWCMMKWNMPQPALN